MNTPNTTAPSIKLLLDVTKWGVNVYSSQSNIPSATKSEVGIVNVTGKSKGETPEGLTFQIKIFPDGTLQPPTEYKQTENKVFMSISTSQMPSLLHVLKHSDQAHALYRVDDGVVHADIHGEFTRVN